VEKFVLIATTGKNAKLLAILFFNQPISVLFVKQLNLILR